MLLKQYLGLLRLNPFHKPEIIKVAYDVKKLISDYVDCVIVATATVLKRLWLQKIRKSCLIGNIRRAVWDKHSELYRVG